MKPILLSVLFLFVSLMFAQDDKDGYSDYLDEKVLDFIYKSRPMVEINYGVGSPSNKNIKGYFADVGSWDIKLGKSELKYYNNFLVDLSERYLFGSYMSATAQNFTSTDDKILTESYRLGFGLRDGIGYGGSSISVVPYVSQDFVWTKLNEYNNQSHPDNMRCLDFDAQILNDYYGAFRFGDKASYGVKIEVASTFQINTFYETSVIYKRHLFWYWAGSVAVSQGGYSLLTHFTDDIVESSPILGPIFNFALKAGYLYGYHLLRQESMNWPFSSSGNDVPLTFETFNIGVSFVF